MAEWPKPQFGANDWDLQATNCLADGFFKLDQLTLTHRGYQAESIGPMHRELFIRTPAVVVILCDLARKELVMVEQFRIGAAMSDLDDSPWMLEWVAGICDDNESPVKTCHREVMEETGLTLASDPELLFTYYPSPGGSNELIHLFFAPCDASGISRYRGQAGEHEDLKVHVISVASAMEALQTGKMNNAATIIGLQWLTTNQAHLLEGE
jgi:ADP-ribose pyrophosphatase